LLCVGAALAFPSNPWPIDDKVVGGEEPAPHQYPFQVALRIPLPDGTAFCGGALISENYVLTAAHCVEIAGATEWQVTLGAHNVSDTNEVTQINRVVPLANAKIHPSWNPNLLQNDLALLKFTEPVEFNDQVQPLRLPSRSMMTELFVDEDATIVGWGKYNDSINSISPVLRHVTKNVITRANCNQWYLGVIQPTHICTSGSNGQSSCSGDSGGPLVYHEADGQPTTIGIVSFGVSFGCSVNYPPVFTRVTEFIVWISNETGIPLRI